MSSKGIVFQYEISVNIFQMRDVDKLHYSSEYWEIISLAAGVSIVQRMPGSV